MYRDDASEDAKGSSAEHGSAEAAMLREPILTKVTGP